MTLNRLALMFYLLFFAFPITAQQSNTTSTSVAKDPQAVSVASASLAALSGKVQIGDVTLVGTATRTIGSDIESGAFTAKSLGTSESRLDLNLSDGTDSEIRNVSSAGGPQGVFVKPSASPVPLAQHNLGRPYQLDCLILSAATGSVSGSDLESDSVHLL
jgi:hypothetical protein